MKLESVRTEWIIEEYPDLSWLETTIEDGQITDSMRYTQGEYNINPEEVQRWINEDHQRLANYGDTWVMQGCYAKAVYTIPLSDNTRITQTVRSGGLYGIESDSDPEHKKEIEAEELAQLKDILQLMNIDTTQYNHLTTQ